MITPGRAHDIPLPFPVAFILAPFSRHRARRDRDLFGRVKNKELVICLSLFSASMSAAPIYDCSKINQSCLENL